MPTQIPGASPDFPDELAQLPHGRHGLPPEFVEHNQRERLIASFIDLVGRVGYTEATISATTSGASVSSRTFYKYFDTLEDCYFAAFDSILDRLGPNLRDAFMSEKEWPAKVRVALAALLEYLTADPAAARLLTAEPFVAGPAMAERYKAVMEQVARYLSAGRELRDDLGESLPDTTEFALLGAMSAQIGRRAFRGGPENLTDLLPDLVQFALTPYLGPAEAHRVANP